jgi:predicted nucleic acid-binding Zn ribbon protein
MSPSRDDDVTTCPVCDQPLSERRSRQRYCSAACRQAAYRRRQPVAPTRPLPPARSRRSTGIYECDDCGTRYVASQWCKDCNRPCRRVGTGGHCPECDTAITIDELLAAVPG